MKVVFDMDTGVDDSLALIYALNRPAYEIQGIGCVYGNVESWLAAENTITAQASNFATGGLFW